MVSRSLALGIEDRNGILGGICKAWMLLVWERGRDNIAKIYWLYYHRIIYIMNCSFQHLSLASLNAGNRLGALPVCTLYRWVALLCKMKFTVMYKLTNVWYFYSQAMTEILWFEGCNWKLAEVYWNTGWQRKHWEKKFFYFYFTGSMKHHDLKDGFVLQSLYELRKSTY